MPLVSVVMPAYGHERFVGQAIESVLAQTLKNWELIVIDDDSKDGTWREVQRFQDPRIVSGRHQFNRGAAATLNEGVACAQGRYIAILNSDDVYHDNRLERLVGYLERNDLDLVGSEVRLIDAAGELIEDEEHDWVRWYQGRLELLRSSNEIADALLGGNVFVTTSNFVFRRTLVDKVGDFPNLRYTHDYAFLFAAMAQGDAAIALLTEEPLLDYRWHGGNTIREDAWEVGKETFGLICQYLPLLLPQDVRVRADLALRHLLGLAFVCANPEAGDVPRLAAEVDRLADERGRLLAELDRLAGERARLAEERDRLVVEQGQLRADIASLYASYSFRLGAALLHPVRFLRGLVVRHG